MSTTMDENTVTANLVTFINCLSLPERKYITCCLFGEKYFLKEEEPDLETINNNLSIIREAKDLKWQISYHTSAFEGCQPDITIDLEKTSLYIEVKTKLRTGLTPSECQGGLREKNIQPENHLYLLPDFYDCSRKIRRCPVCYWKDFKILLDDAQINCDSFFGEIGKYIENFIFNTRTLTTGELSMIYEPEYIHEVMQLLSKMHDLINDCDEKIISRLNMISKDSFSPSDYVGYGGEIYSSKWINYNNDKCLGYGIYDYLFDQMPDMKKKNICDFVFCIWLRKDVKELKGIEGKDFVINSLDCVFYPLDRKILAVDDYDTMKEKFITAVVDKFNDILFCGGIQ